MYGLRASISGHSADVRCMIPCNYPMNGGFVTGGRDNDAKLWFPSGSGPGYEMLTHFRGSTHWVASLAYMEPDADNINGLLFVGSFGMELNRPFFLEFKGSSDPTHLIFEINVGESRIRHLDFE